MRELRERSDGALMIELSIVLPIFMLIILCIYGLFSITSAQNQITHALFQSSRSLSLDPYLTEHVDSVHEAKTFWAGLDSIFTDFWRRSNDEHFSSATNWYISENGNAYLAKQRFVGYLAGGDETAADETLRALGVVGGLKGLTFDMSVTGSDMTITIQYELQFWMDAFDLGKIPIEQSVTARLWGL